jgi:hypothetical protein
MDHVDAVNALLMAGAHVNAANRYGATPLNAASRRGNVHAVNALLSAGADVECRDVDDSTPLHVAASCVHPLVVAALLAGGADATAVDRQTGRIAAQAIYGLPRWARAVLGAPLDEAEGVSPDTALDLHALLREAAAWRRRRPAVVACAAPELLDRDSDVPPHDAEAPGSKRRGSRREGGASAPTRAGGGGKRGRR